MTKSLSWFIGKGLIMKEYTISNLASNHMKKARSNLVTMELLAKSLDFREALGLPEDYEPDEWVVVSAYYSMYMSALSVLAKLGYKSKNYTATILALEEFFVRKKLLEKNYLEILEKAKVKKEELDELNKARDRRETAQYSVTKETTKTIANETKLEAHKFVDRMEELSDLLE